MIRRKKDDTTDRISGEKGPYGRMPDEDEGIPEDLRTEKREKTGKPAGEGGIKGWKERTDLRNLWKT